MTKLTKPESFFEDLFDFRPEFDELFNRLMMSWPFSTSREYTCSRGCPRFACVDSEAKRYHVRVVLPSIDPNSVQLNLQGNTPTVSAERKEGRETKEVNYLYRELSCGTFERTLTLPEGVETDKINAEYQNGVVAITAPITAAALPRRSAGEAAGLAGGCHGSEYS